MNEFIKHKEEKNKRLNFNSVVASERSMLSMLI